MFKNTPSILDGICKEYQQRKGNQMSLDLMFICIRGYDMYFYKNKASEELKENTTSYKLSLFESLILEPKQDILQLFQKFITDELRVVYLEKNKELKQMGIGDMEMKFILGQFEQKMGEQLRGWQQPQNDLAQFINFPNEFNKFTNAIRKKFQEQVKNNILKPSVTSRTDYEQVASKQQLYEKRNIDLTLEQQPTSSQQQVSHQLQQYISVKEDYSDGYIKQQSDPSTPTSTGIARFPQQVSSQDSIQQGRNKFANTPIPHNFNTKLFSRQLNQSNQFNNLKGQNNSKNSIDLKQADLQFPRPQSNSSASLDGNQANTSEFQERQRILQRTENLQSLQQKQQEVAGKLPQQAASNQTLINSSKQDEKQQINKQQSQKELVGRKFKQRVDEVKVSIQDLISYLNYPHIPECLEIETQILGLKIEDDFSDNSASTASSPSLNFKSQASPRPENPPHISKANEGDVVSSGILMHAKVGYNDRYPARQDQLQLQQNQQFSASNQSSKLQNQQLDSQNLSYINPTNQQQLQHPARQQQNRQTSNQLHTQQNQYHQQIVQPQQQQLHQQQKPHQSSQQNQALEQQKQQTFIQQSQQQPKQQKQLSSQNQPSQSINSAAQFQTNLLQQQKQQLPAPLSRVVSKFQLTTSQAQNKFDTIKSTININQQAQPYNQQQQQQQLLQHQQQQQQLQQQETRAQIQQQPQIKATLQNQQYLQQQQQQLQQQKQQQQQQQQFNNELNRVRAPSSQVYSGNKTNNYLEAHQINNQNSQNLDKQIEFQQDITSRTYLSNYNDSLDFPQNSMVDSTQISNDYRAEIDYKNQFQQDSNEQIRQKQQASDIFHKPNNLFNFPKDQSKQNKQQNEISFFDSQNEEPSDIYFEAIESTPYCSLSTFVQPVQKVQNQQNSDEVFSNNNIFSNQNFEPDPQVQFSEFSEKQNYQHMQINNKYLQTDQQIQKQQIFNNNSDQQQHFPQFDENSSQSQLYQSQKISEHINDNQIEFNDNKLIDSSQIYNQLYQPQQSSSQQLLNEATAQSQDKMILDYNQSYMRESEGVNQETQDLIYTNQNEQEEADIEDQGLLGQFDSQQILELGLTFGDNTEKTQANQQTAENQQEYPHQLWQQYPYNYENFNVENIQNSDQILNLQSDNSQQSGLHIPPVTQYNVSSSEYLNPIQQNQQYAVNYEPKPQEKRTNLISNQVNNNRFSQQNFNDINDLQQQLQPKYQAESSIDISEQSLNNSLRSNSNGESFQGNRQHQISYENNLRPFQSNQQLDLQGQTYNRDLQQPQTQTEQLSQIVNSQYHFPQPLIGNGIYGNNFAINQHQIQSKSITSNVNLGSSLYQSQHEFNSVIANQGGFTSQTRLETSSANDIDSLNHDKVQVYKSNLDIENNSQEFKVVTNALSCGKYSAAFQETVKRDIKQYKQVQQNIILEIEECHEDNKNFYIVISDERRKNHGNLKIKVVPNEYKMVDFLYQDKSKNHLKNVTKDSKLTDIIKSWWKFQYLFQTKKN